MPASCVHNSHRVKWHPSKTDPQRWLTQDGITEASQQEYYLAFAIRRNQGQMTRRWRTIVPVKKSHPLPRFQEWASFQTRSPCTTEEVGIPSKLAGWLFTWLYAVIKIHRIVHLKRVHFTVYKIHYNETLFPTPLEHLFKNSQWLLITFDLLICILCTLLSLF